MKNYGLDLTKEQSELRGDEWVFGALSSPCLFATPEAQRSFFLPLGELQNIGEEKSGCVSRAYINILETKFTYAYRNNLLKPENKKWLEDKGYVEGDRVVFADTNIEILSGTTRQGNSLKAPADAIRKHGLVPKKLLPQLNTWDDHYNPARVTEEIKQLGLSFLGRFSLNYEQVHIANLSELLARDTVALAVYAWPKPMNGEYQRTELPANHCVMGYATPMTYIFDNYLDEGKAGDFIKKLAADYYLYEYGYRLYVSAQNVPSLEDVPEPQKSSLFAWLAKMIAWLFSKQGPMPEIPKEILPEKPMAPKVDSKITEWAKGIELFESGGDPDAANYRRNNPGNIKNSMGEFIVYKSYEAGLAALCNYLIRACTDQHMAYTRKAKALGKQSSGDLTLVEFFEVYAPDGPIIVQNYADFVASRMGVHRTILIRELV